MANDKNPHPVETMMLFFFSCIVGFALSDYLMVAMHEACWCVRVDQWWPFRAVTSLASATITLLVFYTLRRIAARWLGPRQG